MDLAGREHFLKHVGKPRNCLPHVDVFLLVHCIAHVLSAGRANEFVATASVPHAYLTMHILRICMLFFPKHLQASQPDSRIA